MTREGFQILVVYICIWKLETQIQEKLAMSIVKLLNGK